MEAARKKGMRNIKLTGREMNVVRALGFTEAATGADLIAVTNMAPEDITDTLNSLMSAGFAESIPYYDQVQVAQMPATSFEINPAYASGLREALYR